MSKGHPWIVNAVMIGVMIDMAVSVAVWWKIVNAEQQKEGKNAGPGRH